MNKIAKRITQDQTDACIHIQNKYEHKCQTGLVLIEVIIMIALGLLVLSVLIEMLVVSHKSLQMQTSLYQIQENASAAVSILTTEIHQAGHIGCAKLARDFPIHSFGDYQLNAGKKLIGTSLNEIIVQYADYPNTFISQTMQDDKTLITNNDMHFVVGDILLISNCKQAEIVVADNVKIRNGIQFITARSPLHHRYEKYSEISRFIHRKYFIAETDRKNPDGSKVYSLYVEDIHHKKAELSEGINQMKMSYTINQAGRLQDVSANVVNDWADIVGVSIDFDLSGQGMKKTWRMYAVVQGAGNE